MSPATRAAAYLAMAVLLTACGTGEDTEGTAGTTGATSERTTMTGATHETAARAQAEEVDALLARVWEQFDLPGKPGVEEQSAPGAIIACSFDASRPVSAWHRSAVLQVAEQEDLELERQQAERVRTWLGQEGWKPVRNPGPPSDLVSYHRDPDGYVVTVVQEGDFRVKVDVESPCFDAEGHRVRVPTSP